MMTTATLKTNAPVQKRANVNTHTHTRACQRAWKTNLFLALTLWMALWFDFTRFHGAYSCSISPPNRFAWSQKPNSRWTTQWGGSKTTKRFISYFINNFFFTLQHLVCVRVLCHEPFELMHVSTLLFSPLCFRFWAVVAAAYFFLLARFHSVLFILCSACGIHVVGFLRMNGPSECCIKCLQKAKPQSHPDHIFMCC